MFCLFWRKTALHPRRDFGHQLLSASWEISFPDLPSSQQGQGVSIASGQTVAMTLQIWRHRGPCSGPLSLLCFRAFPHDRPLVWWRRGPPGVGRAGPRRSGPHGWQTHLLLLEGLLCALETTRSSLSWSVLWVATANESACVTARRSQAPGCEGAMAPVIRRPLSACEPFRLGEGC